MSRSCRGQRRTARPVEAGRPGQPSLDTSRNSSRLLNINPSCDEIFYGSLFYQ